MSLSRNGIMEREVFVLILEDTDLTRSFAWQGVQFKIKRNLIVV
jgi:hypothetical protein